MRPNNYKRVILVLAAVVLVEAVLLLFSCRKKQGPPTPGLVSQQAKFKTQRAVEGKIAIVLDDWGYNQTNLAALERINEPLTVSILPNLNYSTQIAIRARELGKETILHLPLEPYKEEHYRLEHNTILVGMPEAEVLKILKDDFKGLPGIKGISNHMGSKATEDKTLMKIIFSELKKRKLYFLDSFTSKTVCKDLALELGLPYGRRHVFLDNNNNPEYILGQIEILARVARQQGAAIGIGHCRQKTLEVLISAIPQLKQRGFKFVFVSELVK